ncbi:MAG: hypothetical protein J3K34DRAFT_407232 [Monoraphidium minutum]|nr:MAG: hypothetical protein J3K34DRAFT_407232 [Monoraphidium minutum]
MRGVWRAPAAAGGQCKTRPVWKWPAAPAGIGSEGAGTGFVRATRDARERGARGGAARRVRRRLLGCPGLRGRRGRVGQVPVQGATGGGQAYRRAWCTQGAKEVSQALSQGTAAPQRSAGAARPRLRRRKQGRRKARSAARRLRRARCATSPRADGGQLPARIGVMVWSVLGGV